MRNVRHVPQFGAKLLNSCHIKRLSFLFDFVGLERACTTVFLLKSYGDIYITTLPCCCIVNEVTNGDIDRIGIVAEST